MKKLVFLLILKTWLVLPLDAQDANSFTLRGSVAGKPAGTMYLRYSSRHKIVTDSSEVKKGKLSSPGYWMNQQLQNYLTTLRWLHRNIKTTVPIFILNRQK